MEEVSEEELKATLHRFQMDKSSGPDGWTIEFLLEAYDIIVPELLQLVEETRINSHLYPPLNTTFLSLIPKNIIRTTWRTSGLSPSATSHTRW